MPSRWTPGGGPSISSTIRFCQTDRDAARYHGRDIRVVIDLIPDELIRNISAGLTVLTSMITPALLISASGTFILSTSNRLGRVIDRVRKLSDDMDQLMQEGQSLELLEERRDVIFRLIDGQAGRARLLVRALMVFYVATGSFVATSVAIGIVSVLNKPSYSWIPVLLGIGGACLLFVGSVMMIYEARMAISTLAAENRFLDKLVEFHTRNRLTSS